MGEDFVSHVIFHFGAHDVAIISNEIIAVKIQEQSVPALTKTASE